MAVTLAMLKKELADHKDHVYAMALQGGAYSRKTLKLQKSNGLIRIINRIDDSTQKVTWLQLMDTSYTNIGKAIKAKAFYHYTTD